MYSRTGDCFARVHSMVLQMNSVDHLNIWNHSYIWHWFSSFGKCQSILFLYLCFAQTKIKLYSFIYFYNSFHFRSGKAWQAIFPLRILCLFLLCHLPTIIYGRTLLFLLLLLLLSWIYCVHKSFRSFIVSMPGGKCVKVSRGIYLIFKYMRVQINIWKMI